MGPRRPRIARYLLSYPSSGPAPNESPLSSPDNTNIPRSPAAITAVAWAPDGSVVVSGNQAGELTLWQEAKAVATAQVSWGNLSSLCKFCPIYLMVCAEVGSCIDAWERKEG